MSGIKWSPETVQRFWSKVEKGAVDQCWLWTASRFVSGGYGQFMFERYPHRAHRVSYELTHGPIQQGLVVMHVCDNPPCCNPSHLCVGTLSDNSRDAVRKNRMFRPMPTKIGDADALAIRASSERVGVLARKYGVSQALISGIKAGYLPKRWRSNEYR